MANRALQGIMHRAHEKGYHAGYITGRIAERKEWEANERYLKLAMEAHPSVTLEIEWTKLRSEREAFQKEVELFERRKKC